MQRITTIGLDIAKASGDMNTGVATCCTELLPRGVSLRVIQC
jgi:hypothetical protein